MITSIQNRATTGKLLALAVLLATILAMQLSTAPAGAAVTSGQAFAWGNDYYGQLGDGAAGPDTNLPGGVSNLAGAKSVKAGCSHGLALKENGRVWAWGLGNYGRLGSGNSDSQVVPVRVKIDNVKAISAGNDREGVLILGNGADGNRITGNYIGTDKSGAAPLRNIDEGVFIYDVSNNTVGGTTAGAGNVISFSTEEDGVQIYGLNAKGNRILSNSIFSNAGLGIELDNDGPTPNDPDDADTGPNNLQNFPVLSSARKNAAGTTTVRGKLHSTPSKTFTVQFFSNPSGTKEGKTLLGSKSITTDGSGDDSFSFSTKKAIRLGQNITATGAEGTSELSAPRKVVAS